MGVVLPDGMVVDNLLTTFRCTNCDRFVHQENASRCDHCHLPVCLRCLKHVEIEGRELHICPVCNAELNPPSRLEILRENFWKF